jgi:2-polyprenyl-6-methoxyphenol hydroxylase-like FAD-dependent oxidoreductase
MMNHKLLGNTAVVIGGSMAGLLTARVLSDFYAQVTILERDALPETAVPRKGVPQGRHAHALLGRGHTIMEEMFPGLTKALLEQGVVSGHGRFYSGGGLLCRHPQTPPALFASRPCLETEVRGRLLALPNVRLIDSCDVLGMTTSADYGCVTGVCFIRRQSGAAEETLVADLIIDASGRGSRTPAWLESFGYDRPEVELVEVNMGYATRFYQREPEHLDGDLMINVAPTLDNKRACGLLAQEGDRWIVTLAGYFGDYPPTDEEGYMEYARCLPVPAVYELICGARPLSEPVAFKFPSNQWRHYERLDRFPVGLLVVGDALCSFTPIYGQGMTVAAMEVEALRDCLAVGLDNLAQRFFKRTSQVVAVPWSITVGNDKQLAGTAAPPPARFINWYLGKLQQVARHDPEVSLAFMKVANLLAAPPSLLHPRLALRVLRGRLRRPPEPQPAKRPEPLSQPLY